MSVFVDQSITHSLYQSQTHSVAIRKFTNFTKFTLQNTRCLYTNIVPPLGTLWPCFFFLKFMALIWETAKKLFFSGLATRGGGGKGRDT